MNKLSLTLIERAHDALVNADADGLRECAADARRHGYSMTASCWEMAAKNVDDSGIKTRVLNKGEGDG